MCPLRGRSILSSARSKKLLIFYREEVVVLSVVDIFHMLWISSDYYTFAIFGELLAIAGLPPQEEPIKFSSFVLFAAEHRHMT